MASTRAYNTDHFHKEEERETVFVAVRPSFLEKDWFAPENKSPFGETNMKRAQFPCMRSIGNDVDATVNESFLENFQVLTSPTTSFCDYVSKSFRLFPTSIENIWLILCLKLAFFSGQNGCGQPTKSTDSVHRTFHRRCYCNLSNSLVFGDILQEATWWFPSPRASLYDVWSSFGR